MNAMKYSFVLVLLSLFVGAFGPTDVFSARIVIGGADPACNSSDHKPFTCETKTTTPPSTCEQTVQIKDPDQQTCKDELVQSVLTCKDSGCKNVTKDVWQRGKLCTEVGCSGE